MPQAEDDFELILRRCRERLSAIRLDVPELDAQGASSAPPIFLEALTLDVPSAPKPAPVADRPPPPLPRMESAAAAPAPRPAAPPQVTEEREVFPPDRPLPSQQSSRRLPQLGRPAALVAAAALAAATGLAAYRVLRPARGAVIIPLARAADGMTVRAERNDILVAEGAEMIALSRAGTVLERRTLDEPVVALNWDQGSLWSLDGRSPELTEVKDGARRMRYRLNHIPTSLFVRGAYVWTSDRAAGTIHQYLISRSILGVMLQPLDRIDLPGMDVATFAFDPAGDLWVVDAGRRVLCRLKSSGGAFKPAACAPLSPLLGTDGNLRGLFLEEGGVWLAGGSDSGASLRRIPTASLRWQ